MCSSVNEKLIHWIKKKVLLEYSNDICLVVLYGSFTNGTAHAKSDVDCYFIPKTQRAYSFTQTFIIDDVGYDIFPISWERAEKIVDLKEVLLPLIGDATVLYYGSEADLLKFSRLQATLTSNLSDPQKTYTAAVERVHQAYACYHRGQNNTSAAVISKNAGRLIMTLADAVAFYHHTYYHFGLKRQFQDFKNLPDIPSELWQEYQKVIQAKTAADRLSHCDHMLQAACRHMNIPPPPSKTNLCETLQENTPQTDYGALASFYEELCSTFQKIYICCQTDDFILAYLSAVCLQYALDDAHTQFGAEQYDVLSSFHWDCLSRLSRRVRSVETDLVNRILLGGGVLKKFSSFEEFSHFHDKKLISHN